MSHRPTATLTDSSPSPKAQNVAIATSAITTSKIQSFHPAAPRNPKDPRRQEQPSAEYEIDDIDEHLVSPGQHGDLRCEGNDRIGDPYWTNFVPNRRYDRGQ